MFELGRVVATAGAAHDLDEPTIMRALARHVLGDWGDVPAEDARENDLALREGMRILSAYRADDGTRFWILTEADRSVTTVLLPEEY